MLGWRCSALQPSHEVLEALVGNSGLSLIRLSEDPVSSRHDDHMRTESKEIGIPTDGNSQDECTPRSRTV